MYGCLSVTADHLIYVGDIIDVPPQKMPYLWFPDAELFIFILNFFTFTEKMSLFVCQFGFACSIRCLYTDLLPCDISVFITVLCIIFYYNVLKMDIVLCYINTSIFPFQLLFVSIKSLFIHKYIQ